MWKRIITIVVILILISSCHTENDIKTKPQIDRTSEAYQDAIMVLVIRYRHPKWGTKEVLAEVETLKYLWSLKEN